MVKEMFPIDKFDCDIAPKNLFTTFFENDQSVRSLSGSHIHKWDFVPLS